MTIPRSKILDLSRPGWVHCTSRCVRQAFLCGDQFEHRKLWVEDRLKFLSRCFAVEIPTYSIMSNHFHVVMRMQPEATISWSDEEVTRRWLSVYPKKYLPDGTPVLPSEAMIAEQAVDWAWVILRRKQLADLGWFMKALKENIARRANREDGRTGVFWDGRYSSVPLLDQQALIACMAYVDLNPIRAKICDRPERSMHTSAWHRIRARHRDRLAQRFHAQQPQRAELPQAALETYQAEDGAWLTSLSRCTVGEVLANRILTVDDYLTILDATGRIFRSDKRGAIPSSLEHILNRLDMNVADWLSTMAGRRQMNGGGMGLPESRITEAARRGVRWLKNRCPLFAQDAA
jgi:hypothetical protein